MDGGAVHEGGCVCGAVRFKATGEPLRVTVCHCRWCQRRTGSAFGVEVVFARDQVQLTGDGIRRHRHVSDESGRWLDLEFCGRCGGNLGLMVEAAPEIRSLPAGAFDDSGWITPDRLPFRHIYVRSRRDWSDPAAAVEVHEGNFRR
jgi:hypothetical protein